MTKKEIVEKIKEIEKRKIKEGYLKGSITNYMKVNETRSKKALLNFAKVMLQEEIKE